MRVLRDNLEAVLGDGRQPAYKIYAYDPSLDNLGQVVRGEATQTPYDLTSYCSEISWTPAQLNFTLKDPEGLFHPDTGAQRKYLADKAIIRLKEGDGRVSEDDWLWTFTGQIRGQSGWQKARKSRTLESKITVFSRDNSQGYKRRKITSKQYTVGTEIGVFLYDLVDSFMGLDPSEIRIPSVLGLQLRHRVNQISQETPWEAISAILETVGRVPYFDGEGRLTSINKSLARLPDRVLPDYIKVHDYQIPARNTDSVNKVRVVFLDSCLERVDSPYQKLGDAQVTTGFFSMHEKLECWWSDDHKQRADGTNMVVIKSVNSGILPVGTERYTQADEFHGQIDVDISVWVPILASVMLMAYLAAAYKPDATTSESVGTTTPTIATGTCVGGVCEVNIPPLAVKASEVTGTAWTIPVGRIVQAISMVGISLIMMAMGSAQYEVWGTPYDYAYLEKESIAVEDGLSYWEEVEKEIKNDFLGTYEMADNLAVLELVYEKSSSYPRKLILEDDLALEKGDILALPDGRKFLITDMAKTIKRGKVPILTLEGFKVMTP